MDQVIKVLLQFCKHSCGKDIPSKEDIAAVISRLEREGEVKTPDEILDHQKWDSITSALAQHAMSAQKGAKLKTWGLLLGDFKAARKEGKSSKSAQALLRLITGGNADFEDPGGPGNGGSLGS